MNTVPSRSNTATRLLAPRPARSMILSAAALTLFSAEPLMADTLYWSQFGTPDQVGHVDLDGANVVTHATADNTFGMATLDAAQQAYWIENGAIKRSNADFSGVTTLATGVGSALNLTLDPGSNLMFWSNPSAGTISRGNLSDGSLLGSFSAPAADYMQVDPVNHQLYWGDQGGNLKRSAYDGSGVSILHTSGSSISGIDLDLGAGKIYFNQSNFHRISRANLDGTSVETVASLPERPFGLDLSGGRLYWTDLDGGKLRSANTDGSDLSTILTGLNSPRHVSVMGSAVPEPEEYAVVFGLGLFGIVAWRRRAQRQVGAAR